MGADLAAQQRARRGVRERVGEERGRGPSYYKFPDSHLGFIAMMSHIMQSVSLIV